jgi:hypothetical protein
MSVTPLLSLLPPSTAAARSAPLPPLRFLLLLLLLFSVRSWIAAAAAGGSGDWLPALLVTDRPLTWLRMDARLAPDAAVVRAVLLARMSTTTELLQLLRLALDADRLLSREGAPDSLPLLRLRLCRRNEEGNRQQQQAACSMQSIGGVGVSIQGCAGICVFLLQPACVMLGGSSPSTP